METKNQSKYQTKLKDPQWQKKRLEILSRDNWTCVLCKDTKTTLHVHHHEYSYEKNPWDYKDDNFATLCEHCHGEVEVLKKDNCFDDIIIEKFIDLGRPAFLIYAPSLKKVIQKLYDEEGNLLVTIEYETSVFKVILQFIKKWRKLENALEIKSIDK
jgi:hypothetical protein